MRELESISSKKGKSAHAGERENKVAPLYKVLIASSMDRILIYGNLLATSEKSASAYFNFK